MLRDFPCCFGAKRLMLWRVVRIVELASEAKLIQWIQISLSVKCQPSVTTVLILSDLLE